MDQGQLRQAQASANSAAEEFVKARGARDAALAYAVLASILLREGDLSAARGASEKAGNYLSKCSDREAELKVAMSTARVQALAGGLARDAVTKSFQEIASKADRLGFVPYELEPRFVLAEIEVGPGRSGQRAKRARVIAKRGHGPRLRPHYAQGRRRSERSYASELTHSSKHEVRRKVGALSVPRYGALPDGWMCESNALGSRSSVQECVRRLNSPPVL